MIRWSGTLAYLVGMVLTTTNIYPPNLLFGALGGLLWFVVGLQQGDKALMLVEAAAAIIYFAGLLHWAF